MNRQQIAFLTMASAAILALAGCGGSDPAAEPASNSAAPPAATNSAAPSTAPNGVAPAGASISSGASAPRMVNGMPLPPERPGGNPRPPGR